MDKLTYDAINEMTNDQILKWCMQFGFVCYKCPNCGRLSSGLFTSYHAQLHGQQTIHYNPMGETKQ